MFIRTFNRDETDKLLNHRRDKEKQKHQPHAQEEKKRELTPVELLDLQQSPSKEDDATHHYSKKKRAKDSKAAFLKDIQHDHQQAAWIQHRAPDKTDKHEFQFRIAIKPEKENLLAAARVLAHVLCEEELDFKCFIFTHDNDIRVWDTMQMTALDWANDFYADQRGQEVCVYMRFNSQTNMYQRTPSEWKQLLLRCWKALYEANIDIGYTSTPFGDKEILVEDGYLPSPFSYTSSKPMSTRYGALHVENYNPHAYPDPLKGVTFTYQDLNDAGIRVAALDRMEEARLHYLANHLKLAKQAVLKHFIDLHQTAKKKKQLPIDELLLQFKTMLIDRCHQNSDPVTVNDIVRLIEQIALQYPRLANGKFSLHYIIAGLVEFADDRKEMKDVNRFIELLNISAAKIISVLREQEQQSDEKKKQNRAIQKAYRQSTRPDAFFTDFLPLIDILSEHAEKEMRAIQEDFNGIQEAIISLFRENNDLLDDIQDTDREKQKDKSKNKFHQPFDVQDLNIDEWIKINPARMQFCYGLFVLLQHEIKSYEHEEKRAQQRNDREKVMALIKNPASMDTQYFYELFTHYTLKIKMDALTAVQREDEQVKFADTHIKEKINLLQDLVHHELNVIELRLILMEIMETFKNDLSWHQEKREPREKNKSCYLFRIDHPQLTQKKSLHINALQQNLQVFFNKLAANLENTDPQGFAQHLKEFRRLVKDARRQNKLNERAHWKFHCLLPTKSHFDEVLLRAEEKLWWLQRKLAKGEMNEILVSNNTSLYRPN